ncbi:PD-(D/E)XK nuclease family protein [Aquimarina hainanensis]|uniref:PD-(D/E)XK nuclease family protein n=1 Tax=Aquimarina hainanensis TaxID=1578017 RepID=A0ABW5N312_9FLAO
MKSFLEEVLLDIKDTEKDISEVSFIVPSKRAGLFLKKELLALYKDKTVFAPEIISIEEFIEELSGLRQIDNTETLFEFYDAYLHTHTTLEKENLDTFCGWAQTLIYDFNEIDRYCVDYVSFFSYLSGIQDINHWYLQEEKTQLIKNYISFWECLLDYYIAFRDALIRKGVGYQGLLYRRASENIQTYKSTTERNHVFVGFNALNNAEQTIIQELLESEKARVFWDADCFFMENKYHEASLFLRGYQKNWSFYKEAPFEWITDKFSKEKNIKIIGAPKNVGQAKYVGELLTTIPVEEMENTAVVLADESLLLPVLNALPETINSLNITMGMPLKETPIASFFELLFAIHKVSNPQGVYYKSLLELLNNPASYWLLGDTASKVIEVVSKENMVFVAYDQIEDKIEQEKKTALKLLYSGWKDTRSALLICQQLIKQLKQNLDRERNALELEYIYHFYTIFNKLTILNDSYTYLNTIQSLHQFYKDILTTDTLDFRGEPFRGLQLMGMLESRCLDFETVIITSVNEGVLPAGKSTNSFIPYDLKKAFDLPTYKEKDAIYTYHFYRLIQRAKNIYLLYNTENDGVGGGEKSRFLRQLDKDRRPAHHIKKQLISSEVPKIQTALLTVEKTEAVIGRLQKLASYGLSPSALTSYIRNPIDFYYKYVLGIKEKEEVEETIAANTLGTVIHNTLENFYKPFEGKFLTVTDVKKMMDIIDQEVTSEFKKVYSSLDIKRGKNFLIYQVAKRYVYNFLQSEKKMLEQGRKLKICHIESNLKAKVEIDELDFPVFIKGKVDRIDELDGVLRIIDYKTGKVVKNDVVLLDWEVLTEDFKNSKIIQVLAYAYMYFKEMGSVETMQGGIISFKNLKEGFLSFGKKETPRGKANIEITEDTFLAYLTQLKKLIVEIFDMKRPFIEKEV